MKVSRSWALVPVGLVLTLVLLLGTGSLGLRLRSGDDPEGLPDAAALDYGAAPFGAFSALRDSFIRAVLGGVIDPRGTNGAATSGPGGQAIVPASGITTPKRVTVTHALTNDDRADALRVPSVPFTARTDTRRSTREPGETSACGPLRGGTVWYRYRPPADVGLIANTFGSNYATTLSVFAGGGASSIGCDTDVRGNAIVQFFARRGTTYYFQIEGPAGGGDLVFSLDPEGVTTLESVSRTRKPADASARRASLSGDARFVAFESEAKNLVDGQDNGQLCPNFCNDVFVRDRARSTIAIASVDSRGRPGNGWSGAAFMSGNGRYVAFESDATNLVPGDTNGSQDVFVHDLRTRRTERVSVSSSGAQGREEVPTGRVGPAGDFSDPMSFASMSFDGRYVAFQSRATNLVPRDRNQTWDVFVHDRVKRVTERVSVSSSGKERGPDTHVRGPVGNNEWMTPSISGNGRFVSFRTSAANLVKGHDDGVVNTYVHDRLTRTTQRVTRTYTQPEVHASQALSFDGRYVALTGDPSPSSGGPTVQHALVHDRITGRTVRADVSSSGKNAEDNSITHGAAISSDGRYVTFHSNASNLVPGDDNGNFDVFVHDLRTRTTVRMENRIGPTTETGRAICQSPAPAVCGSSLPSISADGSAVAFESAVGPPPVGVSTTDQVQIYVNQRPLPAR